MVEGAFAGLLMPVARVRLGGQCEGRNGVAEAVYTPPLRRRSDSVTPSTIGIGIFVPRLQERGRRARRRPSCASAGLVFTRGCQHGCVV